LRDTSGFSNDGTIVGNGISFTTGVAWIGGMEAKYKGLMDELKIYNYALTDKDIAELYAQRNTLVVKTSSTIINKKTADVKVLLESKSKTVLNYQHGFLLL
jgi:hypothetical protein